MHLLLIGQQNNGLALLFQFRQTGFQSVRAAALFVDQAVKNSKVKLPKDFTKAAEIRDFIAALEKAANKHANKQPRTINPVSFALNVGDGALAHYVPETAAEAKPPTKGELDFILAAGLDSSAIKTSGEAQKTIARLMERDRLGLAKPQQVQLLLELKMKPEQVMLLKANQAGAIIGNMMAKIRAERAG